MFPNQISADGKSVVGWDVVWDPKRPFAMDMAGFAVNLGLFLSRPKAKFAYKVKRGHQASNMHAVSFIRDTVKLRLEASKDKNCPY